MNAATYLVDRQVEAGLGDRVAVRCGDRGMTYAELASSVAAVAGALEALGVRREERVMLVMLDGIELLTGILGAMRLGAVAVPVSTMVTGSDLAALLRDSRARVLLASPELDAVASIEAPDLVHVVRSWPEFLAAAVPSEVDRSIADSPALWLYTSGTTGLPKAAMHVHGSFRRVVEGYSEHVLRLRPEDSCYSVAKLFFAYGLGNSAIFPLAAGATAILDPARPTPATVAQRLLADRPTLFFATPSFYAALLSADVPSDAFASVRLAVSAGEPLPAPLAERFRDRYRLDITDGLGTTEALHIFLSNGRPVPGYDVELRSDTGARVSDGEPGHLFVRGPSLMTGYWCRTATTRAALHGEWLRTGDVYTRSADGVFTCLGRSDDMLKAGGIWVSPAEVEARLLEHPTVAQAAVVGVPDADGIDKPVAYVVPVAGSTIDPDELIEFTRAGLASYKRPRRVVVVADLPRTATGKLRRFAVREWASGESATP